MIELTVLNDSNVELNTVDDGLIGLDVVMATGGGSEIHNQDKTVTPTESEQSVTADVGYTGLGTVTVEGIDSEYVGSDIPRNTSSDLLTEGATVIAPSGYYENSATKTVQMGTAGTPTASKGAVSNHSVSVTPSVTNQAGYIYSETKTGTAVSISASELVSGTKSISANGTEDVTNYASVSVSVPNSYSASDEGKVVSSGALVAQTSDTVTANDTYDTTLINSLTVNVSGGGGSYDFLDKANPSGELTTDRTSIAAYTAYQRTGITKVSAPNLTRYYEHAFYGCTSLTSIPTENITHIGEYAFYGCKALTELEFPNVEGTTSSTDMRHGAYMFAQCTNLRSISFPKAGYWRNKAHMFDGCTNLVSANFPKCTAMSGTHQFYNCTSLPALVLPKLGGGNVNFNINTNFLGNCTSLTAFDVLSPYQIDATAFSGASIMNVLVIRGKGQTTLLGNINAFTGTPFASNGSGGTLYVPESKLSAYQSATNWSTILGYANNQIKSIESTHTDPDAPIDLTTHYADGTLIPS